jgi:hypothetical protein
MERFIVALVAGAGRRGHARLEELSRQEVEVGPERPGRRAPRRGLGSRPGLVRRLELGFPPDARPEQQAWERPAAG